VTKNLFCYYKKQFGNNKSALYEIIQMYEKLIIKNSFVNGRFDEDCKAYIENNLIISIKKFKIF